MIDYKLSRIIIEIPWLHNTIGAIFLLLITLYLLGIPTLLYKIIKSSGKKTKEWSFEGKNWDYWKEYK